MGVQVIFSLSALNKLERRAAPLLAECSNALEPFLTALRERIERVFPETSHVVVQEVYHGFRQQQRHEFILGVEVTQGHQTRPMVVKLGEQNRASGERNRLAEELDNWNVCRPDGVDHDLVLMGLRAAYHGNDLIALIYEDAQQMIGVEQTVPLEDALLACVRVGEPTPQAVAHLLFEMYERLGRLLYSHSFDDNPHRWEVGPDVTAEADAARIDRYLLQNLDAWEREPEAMRLRCEVTTELEPSEWKDLFHDPVYHLSYRMDHRLERPFPQMLRGRAHGDLHGRNILVGRVEDLVLWPAVFDYGNMGANNLIAWDFVKLETEFKIRAYPRLFLHDRSFSHDVVRFETAVDEATRTARDPVDRLAPTPLPSPADRLKWLLLRIRSLAARHLGQSNRSQLWRKEYDFVLSVYGLNSVRFSNLEPLERKAAYLSAGCAAARSASAATSTPAPASVHPPVPRPRNGAP